MNKLVLKDVTATNVEENEYWDFCDNVEVEDMYRRFMNMSKDNRKSFLQKCSAECQLNYSTTPVQDVVVSYT